MAELLILAGVGVGAAGTLQAGREQKAMLAFEADLKAREARAIRQKATFEQQRQTKQATRIKSALRTKLAGSGARMDIGAPLMLQEEQAAELELANFLIGAEGEEGFQMAMLERKVLKKKGKAAETASYYKAGSTLLTGFGSTF